MNFFGIKLYQPQCRKVYFMKLLQTVFLVMFLVCAIQGCGDDSPPSTAAEAPAYEGLIAAVGNSLTEGLGVAEDSAYPALLEKKLLASGYRYQVINAGVSGETSSATLARIKWILKLKPDIVILVIGANDGFRGIDPGLIESNIRAIIETLKKNSATVLLGGMQMAHNLGADYTRAFASIYPRMAREENIGLIPFFLDGVAGNPNLNQADGIHPTAEGYREVVDHIFPYVIETIKARKKD